MIKSAHTINEEKDFFLKYPFLNEKEKKEKLTPFIKLPYDISDKKYLSLYNLSENTLLTDQRKEKKHFLQIDILKQIIKQKQRFIFFVDDKNLLEKTKEILSEKTYFFNNQINFKLSRLGVVNLLISFMDIDLNNKKERNILFDEIGKIVNKYFPVNVCFSVSCVNELTNILQKSDDKDDLIVKLIISAMTTITPFLPFQYDPFFDIGIIKENTTDDVLIYSESPLFKKLFYVSDLILSSTTIPHREHGFSVLNKEKQKLTFCIMPHLKTTELTDSNSQPLITSYIAQSKHDKWKYFFIYYSDEMLDFEALNTSNICNFIHIENNEVNHKKIDYITNLNQKL